MLNDVIIAELLKKAEEAIKRAYAPYSNFRVGCSVLSTDGEIFSGANVENASFSLCICAERIACSNCVLACGDEKIKAICILSEYGTNSYVLD